MGGREFGPWWWYFAGMEAASAVKSVKKSIYLDSDVDEALRESAQRDGRSVTKQLNLLLRNALGQQQSNRNVTLHVPQRYDQRPFRGPDPKVKSPGKSKKLT